MKINKPGLCLDQSVTYHIKVPGVLDEGWLELCGSLKIIQEYYMDGMPVTVFIAKGDQAALHSLLRRLYSMGLPLISIQLIGEM